MKVSKNTSFWLNFIYLFSNGVIFSALIVFGKISSELPKENLFLLILISYLFVFFIVYSLGNSNYPNYGINVSGVKLSPDGKKLSFRMDAEDKEISYSKAYPIPPDFDKAEWVDVDGDFKHYRIHIPRSDGSGKYDYYEFPTKGN